MNPLQEELMQERFDCLYRQSMREQMEKIQSKYGNSAKQQSKSNIMNAIAKFKCVRKEKTQYNEGISLEPVTSGSPENEEFYKTTPSGVIHIQTCNPDAANSFEIGKEYFVSFSPAN